MAATLFPHPRPTGAARPVGTLIAAASIALLVMPLFSTFGELLTNAALATGFDALLGRWIAPAEAQAVHGVLALLGLRTSFDGPILFVGDGARSVALYISWNCVGWQTLLFLLVSLATGLQGEYTLRSRIETALLGTFGIVLLNVFRITVVALVAYAFGRLPAVLVHDYGSIVLTVAYLMAFWLFAFAHLLERRDGDEGVAA
ncbi:MAG: exosortase/archaeosortase family protein [Candidatus Limnocylindria bacterium]